MITLQHTLVDLIALLKNSDRNITDKKELINALQKELPYVLFPDAIRAYIRERQKGHFEEPIEGEDISYMKYPKGTDIKKLSKDNADEIIESHIVGKVLPCVIGENTNINSFDNYNMQLDDKSKYYYRAHLLQDIELDKALRNLVDVSNRFNDVFVIKNTGRQINGQELRNEVSNFEMLGFLELAKIVYKETGIIVNQEWFDSIVKPSLEQVYSADLAERTYKYMTIPKEINDKITNLDFEVGNYTLQIATQDELKKIFKEMYTTAISKTIEQQKYADSFNNTIMNNESNSHNEK